MPEQDQPQFTVGQRVAYRTVRSGRVLGVIAAVDAHEEYRPKYVMRVTSRKHSAYRCGEEIRTSGLWFSAR